MAYLDPQTVQEFRDKGATVLRGVFSDWVETLRAGIALRARMFKRVGNYNKIGAAFFFCVGHLFCADLLKLRAAHRSAVQNTACLFFSGDRNNGDCTHLCLGTRLIKQWNIQNRNIRNDLGQKRRAVLCDQRMHNLFNPL